MQTSDESKEEWRLGDFWLIQYQILQTNIIRIVWQIVRKEIDEILGVKGLTIIFFNIEEFCEMILALQEMMCVIHCNIDTK